MLSTRRRQFVNMLIFLLLILFILYSSILARFRTPEVALGSSGGSFLTKTYLGLENEQAQSELISGSSLHNEGQFVSGNPQISLSSLSSSSDEPETINKVSTAGVPSDDVINRNHIGAEISSERTVLKSEKETEVEKELHRILSISPIVIFSRTKCPFSVRAKNILVKKYSIDPAPHILELDQHPLGSSLQKSLAAFTGRSSVPNVFISGQSIGGCDEVTDLDQKNILATKIYELGKQSIKVQLSQTT
ncbi:hypothetical protein GcM3_036004 [Golovinomyces cichoracearum]|uniref:Glutaredoxin domain-containing protein n=1 Tax=Golovinomyces cichoracearum TaxID=62708 RepID=A0A420J3H8_9PEZI|nr:hypothetical protein GcM3_036004 [Golovinomyces cichoracearum]